MHITGEMVLELFLHLRFHRHRFYGADAGNRFGEEGRVGCTMFEFVIEAMAQNGGDEE